MNENNIIVLSYTFVHCRTLSYIVLTLSSRNELSEHITKSFSIRSRVASDLSTTENLWGWTEPLKEKLEHVRQSTPASFWHNMFDGVKDRMQRVIDLNGDYIRK